MVLDEGSLVNGLVIKLFKSHQVWHIIVSENLLVCPVLVSEHAAATVETVLLVVEGSAVLGLQFLVVDLGHEVVGELVVAMSEFALLVISTHSDFNPVFA